MRLAGGAATIALLFAACSSFDDAATPSDDADGGSDAAQADGGPTSADAASDAPLDLTTDPKNCGAVGHDCLGGACVASACQPFEIYRGQADNPGGDPVDNERVHQSSVAVDGARVAWITHGTNDSRIFACPKTGCPDGGPLTTPAGSGGIAGSIAGDDEGIYVVVLFGSFGIFRVNASGKSKISGAFDYASDIHLVGDRIVVSNRRQNDEMVSGTMPGGAYSMLRDGGGITRLSPVPAQPDNEIRRLGLGKDSVFFAHPSALYQHPLDGDAAAPPSVLYDVPGDVETLVVDRAGDTLYWADRNARTISRCSTLAHGAACANGGEEISFGKLGNAGPTALSFDGTWLYVTADVGSTAGKLFACKPGDCGNTWKEIASGLLFFGPVAFDARAIYWMEQVAGGSPPTYRIVKLAK